jgi:hypothetical protein
MTLLALGDEDQRARVSADDERRVEEAAVTASIRMRFGSPGLPSRAVRAR